MNSTLSYKMKMPSKLFWRQSVPFRDTLINHPCRVLILKHAVLMFIQRSQTPHINNTVNVYRNIGNVFKNHITVIEKNYIAIHIDIELLSSPRDRVVFSLTPCRFVDGFWGWGHLKHPFNVDIWLICFEVIVFLFWRKETNIQIEQACSDSKVKSVKSN